MNKNYLKYLFRERKIALIFFLIVYAGICLTCFISYDKEYAVSSYLTSVRAGIIMSSMLAFALPVLQLSYVHRRRSVDQYFALPVSRKSQLVTEIAFMTAVCTGYLLVTSLITYVIFAAHAVLFSVLLKILAVSCLFLLELILVNSFFYLLANNIFDGIVVIGAYTCLPLLLYLVIGAVVDTLIVGYTSAAGLDKFAWYLSPLVMGAKNTINAVDQTSLDTGYLIAGIVWALLACAGLKYQFIDRKTERAEQLSDEFFAYRFIIHVYLAGILLCMGCALWEEGLKTMVIYYLLLFVVYVIAHFVYKRKIELKASYIAVYLAAALAAAGITAAGWKTRGFGMADRYELFTDKYLIYNYNADAFSDDLGKNIVMSENGYDWESAVSVSFELTVSEDEKEKYAEPVGIMEKLRKQAIDDTYKMYGTPEDNRYLYNGWLSAMNAHNIHSNTDPWTNQFSYNVRSLLSEEELKLLSEYTDVTVYVNETGEEYELPEYLEKRGG